MNYLHRIQDVYGTREARAIYMLVMEKVFGLTPTDVLLGKDKELSAHSNAEMENIVLRLENMEPIQYIIGECEFMGHSFKVGKGVLIPRPETEGLVKLIIQENPTPMDILDIGTGSGCIAISLALEGHRVTAFDISDQALDMASANSKRLGAEVCFERENILHPSTTHRVWEAIASNPPYIRQSEAAMMEDNVLRHEPHIALFVPDDNPLLFYEAIATYSIDHLQPHGKLYFECNREHAYDVAEMLVRRGFRNVVTLRDAFGNLRFVKAVAKDKAGVSSSSL